MRRRCVDCFTSIEHRRDLPNVVRCGDCQYRYSVDTQLAGYHRKQKAKKAGRACGNCGRDTSGRGTYIAQYPGRTILGSLLPHDLDGPHRTAQAFFERYVGRI